LYLLSGLEPYTDGSIQLFDKELNTYSSSDTANLRQTKIGFVFQSYNLIGNLNVYENVLISAVIAGKSDKNRVHEALEMVGMLEYKDLYPNQISGGMQQRVSIARALVNDPEIIFADEPTGNLDHHNGLQIMEILKQLNQNYHKTIILVTHNEDLLSFGTRTIRLNDGLIIEDVETLK
ncbi:MAG: ABC transporter ATP-binding protein, partial [Acholeplasmataceae bacterium]